MASERPQLATREAFTLAKAIEGIEAEAWSQLQMSIPEEHRVANGISVKRRGMATELIASGSDVLAVNRVLGLGLEAELAAADVDDIISDYSLARAKRFVLQWSPFAAPAAAASWFTGGGFRQTHGTAKLIHTFATPVCSRSHTPGLRVTEVSRAEAACFEQIVGGALGVPESLSCGISSTIGHDAWHYYLVRLNDLPIAGAAMFVRRDGAWLGLCVTIDTARGRGAQTALLERRLRDARLAGCKWATADTVPPTDARPNVSFGNMRKLGFELLYIRANYLCELAEARMPARLRSDRSDPTIDAK